MVDLMYSLVIEATDEPDFFGYYSPELEGFSGIGHSVEDCLYKARWGMKEHVELLAEQGLPIPPRIPTPNGRVSNLVFGGPNFDILHAACGDRIYSRKTKVPGANAFQPPIKPAPPRL